MTNEEMLSSFDTREKARWIAMLRGWEGNKEEVDYWENWLKSEVQNDGRKSIKNTKVNRDISF